MREELGGIWQRNGVGGRLYLKKPFLIGFGEAWPERRGGGGRGDFAVAKGVLGVGGVGVEGVFPGRGKGGGREIFSFGVVVICF